MRRRDVHHAFAARRVARYCMAAQRCDHLAHHVQRMTSLALSLVADEHDGEDVPERSGPRHSTFGSI